jgi:ubiquinone/menaquinone biosynthesis C-methylase UbiE
MEHDGEIARLETKTDKETIRKQASWAGLTPGMRIADIGCGAGKTTAVLREMAAPEGSALGVDSSRERIAYARKTYRLPRYEVRDVTSSLADLGRFDFLWSRFLLEYHREKSFDIVRTMDTILEPGGILCLIDLDYNCMTHYELESDLYSALTGSIRYLEQHFDFDPYAGRRLYSYLYDLGYQDIRIEIGTHHLFYGDMSDDDLENWTKKLDVAVAQSGYSFPELQDGFKEFRSRMLRFLKDPRRFSYTPLIICRGIKPRHG